MNTAIRTLYRTARDVSPATASILRLSLELLVQEREEIRAIEEEKKRKRAERRQAKQTKTQGENQ